MPDENRAHLYQWCGQWLQQTRWQRSPAMESLKRVGVSLWSLSAQHCCDLSPLSHPLGSLSKWQHCLLQESALFPHFFGLLWLLHFHCLSECLEARGRCGPAALACLVTAQYNTITTCIVKIQISRLLHKVLYIILCPSPTLFQCIQKQEEQMLKRSIFTILTGLLHSHLPYINNHHKHFSCFVQLNTITAQVLPIP